MFTGIIQFFYPDIKQNDIKKVGLLGIAFFFLIGSYWMLRLLKDLFFYQSIGFPVDLGYASTYGRDMIPWTKTMSIVFVAIALIVYTKLIDMFEKYKLFYIIAGFYTIAFSFIAAVLFFQAQFGNAYVGATLLSFTAYFAYWITESMGSIFVTFFWSFTISSTTSEQAKRTFPFIVMVGQLGSILCSSLVLNYKKLGLDIWQFYIIAMLAFIGIILTIYYLLKTVPADQMKSDKEEKKSKPDILGGLKLLLTNKYIMGIFVVSTFYEIAGTIVDFQMKSQAQLAPNINFVEFQGLYGTLVNVISFTLSLLGTSALMRKFGIRICLFIYPLSFALMLSCLYMIYQFNLASATQLAYAAMAVMLVVKSVAYSVNNPIKEMMYIPTSKDAKFKAKGIIDMFGSRAAKGTGAQITEVLKYSMNALFIYGSLIGLGIIGFWLVAALYVGTKNKELVDSGKIIE